MTAFYWGGNRDTLRKYTEGYHILDQLLPLLWGILLPVSMRKCQCLKVLCVQEVGNPEFKLALQARVPWYLIISAEL